MEELRQRQVEHLLLVIFLFGPYLSDLMPMLLQNHIYSFTCIYLSFQCRLFFLTHWMQSFVSLVNDYKCVGLC
jgi:hypothetical protein